MPKPPTYPILYNKALQINITKLKEWKYLKPKQVNSGTLSWSINGNERGCISIIVNTCSEKPYIELDYKYRDEPRNYKVSLVSMPSNLGKGLIWYFLCPETNKRCRKLYSIGGYFLHRKAFKGCMYEIQTQSKNNRLLSKIVESCNTTENLRNQLNKKYFKKTYAEKPTKKYLRIMEQIQKAESLPYPNLSELF